MGVWRWIVVVLVWVGALAWGGGGEWERGMFGERVRELRLGEGVRGIVNLPAKFEEGRETLVVIFACPNGNSAEWTLGGSGGDDWHFGIQQVLAQVRRVREVVGGERGGRQVVLVVVEAEGRSWPGWRGKRENHGELIRGFVGEILAAVPGAGERVALMAHSGGGAFIWGYLNGGEAIPSAIERIVFLDANYSFDVGRGHGEKLKAWMGEGGRLVVVAYDDRKVAINGKPVLSAPERGTRGATTRMVGAMGGEEGPKLEAFEVKTVAGGKGGGGVFYVRENPENAILHTRLVEWNGVVHGLLWGTEWEGKWGGELGGEAVYGKWVTAAVGEGGTVGPRFAARKADAVGGEALVRSLAGMTVAEREARLVEEILAGNVPEFLRRFKAVDIGGRTVWVSPDYLAVGSDADWVRVGLTRGGAEKVAAGLGCVLPTVEVVDAVWAAAEVRVEPIPLAPRGEKSELPEGQRVDARESVEALLVHQKLVEGARKGELGRLVAGAKKDVVVSERLADKPGRVAIYGWHRLDGKVIQPLSTVHGAGYVDYSHGVRLVWEGK